MPRRNRPRRSSPVEPVPPPAGGLGSTRRESGAGGDFLVRPVPGAQAVKTYRCPGCDHEIRPQVPHVVAWPADESGSVADRRHWHSGCWQARDRRHPTPRRR